MFMEFQSEISHAKNVNNFGSLLVSIEVLGSYYSPHKESLSISHLRTVHKQAKAVMQGVGLSLSVYAAAVDSRMKAWDGIEHLAGRILALCNETERELEQDVNALLKNVRSKNSFVSEHVAVSQLTKFNALLTQNSFEKRLESFDQLVNLISRSKASTVDNGKLLIASMEALQSNFRSKNISVKLAEAALNTARYNRDVLLYRQENNLITLAKEVKEYVKDALGPSYIQYLQIMGTNFRAN